MVVDHVPRQGDPVSSSTAFPTGNECVRLTELQVLSDNWYVLRKAVFDFRDSGGHWSRQEREAYDRGNGATILLVDPERSTVLLTRQFRMPAYLNGHADGMLIEAPAGLLDEDDAEAAIRRETEEETGIRLGAVHPLFELFMSPGSVTERVAFFWAVYRSGDRHGGRGGVDGEDIELIELTLDEAVAMVRTGEISDGKTVLLLLWAQLQDFRELTTATDEGVAP
jgi:nudix-type nucleoside diphosphatase (YffH/AdpP family)